VSIMQNLISSEKDDNLKAGAVLAQASLLNHFAVEYGDDTTLPTGTGTVSFGEMRANAELFKTQTGYEPTALANKDITELLPKLEEWAKAGLVNPEEPQTTSSPAAANKSQPNTPDPAPEPSRP